MNYFAHAWRFLERPEFVTGTALPDWLSVVNRRLRFRSAQLTPALSHGDPRVAEVAAGVRQHLLDDAKFHNSQAFSECLVTVLRSIRPFLNGAAVPPVFLSHLVMELLLDARLIENRPDAVERYYGALERVCPSWTEWAAGQILGQPIIGLAEFVRLFCKERILRDYSDDRALLRRINQVMRRVRLPELEESFVEALRLARPLVGQQASRLLEALDGLPSSCQNNSALQPIREATAFSDAESERLPSHRQGEDP